MRIERVSYRVNWRKFRKGYSFFIPCLDPNKAVKEVLRATDRLKYKVITKAVIRDGIRGLQVWRV